MGHVTVYRSLILGAPLAAVFAMIVDVITVPLLPPPLREYNEAQFASEPTGAEAILLFGGCAFLLVLLAAYLVSLVGLWRYWQPGRTLYLWTGIVGFLTMPLFSVSVTHPLAESIYFLSHSMSAALLVMAYLPPIAVRFEPHGLPDPLAAFDE